MDMTSESDFSDSVIEPPAELNWTNRLSSNGSFNCGSLESSDVPQCSTPLMQTRKNSLLKNIHSKSKPDSTILEAIQENPISEVNNNIKSLVTGVKEVKEGPKTGSHAFICDLFDAIDPGIKNGDENNTTVIENPLYVTLDTTECNTVIELDDETLKEPESTEDDESIEDEATLLISSDEENEVEDIETFIHLLDSPPSSPDCVIIKVSNPTLSSDTQVKNVDENRDKNSLPTPNIEKKPILATSAAKQQSIVNNPPTKMSPRKNILSRSAVLKNYLRRRNNDQQKPYPKWLEFAKDTFNQQDLLELMNTVYLPMSDRNRTRLYDLTTKNYHTILDDMGRSSPYPPNYHDFYNKPIHKKNKRFVNISGLKR